MARRLISLPFLSMAAWAVTLGFLVYDDTYQFFLAPKFGFLIVAGLVLSIIFTLSLALTDIYKDRDHAIKGLTLLIPILFICSAGDSTLGNFALSKRNITPLDIPASDPRTAVTPPQGGSPETTDTDIPLVSISDLIRKWENYDGKHIRVEGLFANTVSGNENYSAVFRYFISCCAADAMPVGVFMAGQEAAGVTDNDWVLAEGRVEQRHINGYDIIFMAVKRLAKKEKPSKNAAYMYN